MTKPEPVLYISDALLYISDAAGIYIPQQFAQSFARTKYISGVSNADMEILENGPDGELYWEVWDDILRNATITGDDGVPYRLDQDGDLWLILIGMEWDDEQGWYIWPNE